MIYNELKQHGKDDFPFELYRLNHAHPKYEMAFHWHTNVEFIRVLSGTFRLTLDNRLYTLGAGDVALVNSETVHGGIPSDCTYECIVFNLAFLKMGNRSCDALIDDLLAHRLLLPELPQGEKVKALVWELFDAIGNDAHGAQLRVFSLVLAILAELWRQEAFVSSLPLLSVNDKRKAVKLKTVLKFIRDNFSKSITLEDMAAVSGYSCKYFCAFFKEMTGTTPINYLMTYRIERAARKRLSTDHSVTQIAYDCGFNDLSYFIKTFKSLKNCSPKEYRKQ